MTIQSRIRSTAIEARLNFLRPMAERPRSYQYDPPAGTPRRNFAHDPRPMIIHDARTLARQPSLDREGFTLLARLGAFIAFGDEEAIRSAYYREVEGFLLQATGGSRVISFDHNVRSAVRAAAGQAGIRPPVDRTHNDFTALSGHERSRRALIARSLDPALLDGRRHAIVNLWRPIGRPVEKSPLALCDAGSLSPGDLVASDLMYPDRTGEIYNLVHNAAQRWFYYPRLTPDEAILIKGYDSLESVARFAPHTAFDDPMSPPDAAERESIETRALVIY